jgi:hypothetical protein
VLIQAWQKYYSPKLCPDYWTILNRLGEQGLIFLPQIVFEEIIRTDDDLTKWVKGSSIPVLIPDTNVTNILRTIFEVNPLHRTLVDNTKNRSLADPWVIAHALNEKAVVVTKEEKVTSANASRIKIPNVCDNMGVTWINDFEFIERMNIRFSCRLIT